MYKIAAAILCGTLLVSIGLFVWSNAPGRDQRSAMATNADDLISRRCSMGSKIAASNRVSATISEYLSGVQAGTTVTRDEVGALIERITPDEIGVELFRIYTACLQAQTEAILIEKGVAVQAEAGDADGSQRDATIEAVSRIRVDTPPERLVQIFGQPLAAEDLPEGTAYKYQLGTDAYAVDYRSGSRRLALVIATPDPEPYFHGLFERMSLAETKGCRGPLMSSSHRHIVSGVCPGHPGNGFAEKVYYFASVDFDDNAICNDPNDAILQTADDCPNFLTALPFAVGMSRSTEDLDSVSAYFGGELQFGSTFEWDYSTPADDGDQTLADR